MKRLTIQNLHKLNYTFPQSVWYYSGWAERDDRYEFSLHRNGSGEKRVFVLSRRGILIGGEIGYETFVVGKGVAVERITHRFLTNPHNLAVHIIASIER